MTAMWDQALERVREDKEFVANMERFLDNPGDMDRLALFRLIVDKGLSPWQAATERAAESHRSRSTLYYLARQLVVKIREHFGITLDDAYKTLLETGEVEVDGLFAEELMEAVRLSGRQPKATYKSIATVTLVE